MSVNGYPFLRSLMGTLVLVLTLSPVFATLYIANDRDWRLSYLLGYYATKTGNYFYALADPELRTLYIGVLDAFHARHPEEEMVIYEGKEPTVENLENILRPKGIRVRTVRYSDSLDLMFSLPRALGFSPKGALMVPDGVGAWMLSAAPYAFREDLAIYLINNKVIDRLTSLPYDRIVIVGYRGKKLYEAYPDAERIATGNKYRDSVEIAKRIRSSQVYVMSGLYLYLPAAPERAVPFTGAGGKFPILISRIDRLPGVVENYILENNSIKVVSFIGPDLFQVLMNSRGRLAGVGKRPIALAQIRYPNVPGVDPQQIFRPPSIPLPSAKVVVRAENVRVLPDKVILLFRNVGDGSGYFTVSGARLECEGIVYKLGSTGPYYIGGGEVVSVVLESNEPIPVNRRCSVSLSAFFGPDVDRMDIPLNKEFSVVSEEIGADPTDVELLGLKYWPSLERVAVALRNKSPVTAYAQARLNLLVDGVERQYRTRVVKLGPGEEAITYVKVYLTDSDILDNEDTVVNLFYGKEPSLLYKLKKVRLRLEKATFTDEVVRFLKENYVLVGAALVLIILVVLFLRRR